MRQNLFYTLLFLFITSSLLAEDIVLSESDNRFSVTEKSYTSFSFINHLHKIKTRVVKTEFGDFDSYRYFSSEGSFLYCSKLDCFFFDDYFRDRFMKFLKSKSS